MLAVAGTGSFFLAKRLHRAAKKPKVVAEIKPPRGEVKGASFAQVNDQLKSCYESLLIRDSAVNDGDVLFHMKLSNTGTVEFLKLVHSDFTESQFEECVTEKVKEMRRPASNDRAGVLIAHRFKFHRNDQGAIDFE
jgi:hypothetical protein